MDDRLVCALDVAFPDREVAAVESAGGDWSDVDRTAAVTALRSRG